MQRIFIAGLGNTYEGGLLPIALFSKCDIIHIEVFKVSSQMPLSAAHRASIISQYILHEWETLQNMPQARMLMIYQTFLECGFFAFNLYESHGE